MPERTAADLPRHPEQADEAGPAEKGGIGALPWTVQAASALLVFNLLLSILVTVLSLTHIGQLVRLPGLSRRRPS